MASKNMKILTNKQQRSNEVSTRLRSHEQNNGEKKICGNGIMGVGGVSL